MILGIDLGNTTVSLAFVTVKSIKVSGRIDILQKKSIVLKQFTAAIRRAKRAKPAVDVVYVCSVVPSLLKVFEPILRKTFREVKIVGRNVHVPIQNKYQAPKQVGQDRLVGAFAAKELYGSPCIIVDFGTAITFDAISKQGAYLGGLIVPGIRLSAEALFQKTALLPRIDQIKWPRQLIGQNTKASILSGLIHGYGEMSAGLVARLKKKIKGQPKVILTGGYTNLMKRFFQKNQIVIDQNLVLKGLAILSK